MLVSHNLTSYELVIHLQSVERLLILVFRVEVLVLVEHGDQMQSVFTLIKSLESTHQRLLDLQHQKVHYKSQVILVLQRDYLHLIQIFTHQSQSHQVKTHYLLAQPQLQSEQPSMLLKDRLLWWCNKYRMEVYQ